MNLGLLSAYEKLQIPEVWTLEHEDLRAELICAARKPGRIGKAAERVAQLCDAHFAKEEVYLFRAFGLLHDLASDRVRPDIGAIARAIVQFSTQHDALHEHHESIDAAVGNLMQEARSEEHRAIAQLVYKLREHEKIENEVLYPTVLEIARAVQEGAVKMRKS